MLSFRNIPLQFVSFTLLSQLIISHKGTGRGWMRLADSVCSLAWRRQCCCSSLSRNGRYRSARIVWRRFEKWTGLLNKAAVRMKLRGGRGEFEWKSNLVEAQPTLLASWAHFRSSILISGVHITGLRVELLQYRCPGRYFLAFWRFFCHHITFHFFFANNYFLTFTKFWEEHVHLYLYLRRSGENLRN